MSFSHVPFIFWTLSGLTRCFKLILYFRCPSPVIGHFSRESWVPLMRIIFRNQDLGAECAHCYWSVDASRPGLKQGNKCKAVQKYIYIYLDWSPGSTWVGFTLPLLLLGLFPLRISGLESWRWGLRAGGTPTFNVSIQRQNIERSQNDRVIYT